MPIQLNDLSGIEGRLEFSGLNSEARDRSPNSDTSTNLINHLSTLTRIFPEAKFCRRVAQQFLPGFWTARFFCAGWVVSVAQLSVEIDSRSRGCAKVGSVVGFPLLMPRVC